MLALGMIAALAMPGTAQATPQLGDLGVKQSMSVKASNGESLEGKDLRAIQLATYTAASVDGNTIVGYDLTKRHFLCSRDRYWDDDRLSCVFSHGMGKL